MRAWLTATRQCLFAAAGLAMIAGWLWWQTQDTRARTPWMPAATPTSGYPEPKRPARLARQSADDPLREAGRRADKDPAAAIEWCLEHLEEQELQRCIAEVLGIWTRRDAPVALAWLEREKGSEGPMADGFSELLAQSMSTWANDQPMEAAGWLAARPHLQESRVLMATLAPWIEYDEAAAVRWAVRELELVQREAILTDLLISVRHEGSRQLLLQDVDRTVAAECVREADQILAKSHATGGGDQ